MLTKNNCRAMTSREFEMLPEFFPDMDNKYTNIFLANFFSRCDEVRFSGAELDLQTITQLLSDVRLYLAVLEKVVRKKGAAA
jgi:hypothetical protein